MKLYTIVNEDDELVYSTHVETERGGRQLGESFLPFYFFRKREDAARLAKQWQAFDRLNVSDEISYSVKEVELDVKLSEE
jgi:hypothetical protein